MFIDFISLSSMMPRLFLDFPALLADLAAISFRIFFVCAPVFFDFFERTTPEPEREKTGWKHNVYSKFENLKEPVVRIAA